MPSWGPEADMAHSGSATGGKPVLLKRGPRLRMYLLIYYIILYHIVYLQYNLYIYIFYSVYIYIILYIHHCLNSKAPRFAHLVWVSRETSSCTVGTGCSYDNCNVLCSPQESGAKFWLYDLDMLLPPIVATRKLCSHMFCFNPIKFRWHVFIDHCP
jgi:hypothetical protein